MGLASAISNLIRPKLVNAFFQAKIKARQSFWMTAIPGRKLKHRKQIQQLNRGRTRKPKRGWIIRHRPSPGGYSDEGSSSRWGLGPTPLFKPTYTTALNRRSVDSCTISLMWTLLRRFPHHSAWKSRRQRSTTRPVSLS